MAVGIFTKSSPGLSYLEVLEFQATSCQSRMHSRSFITQLRTTQRPKCQRTTQSTIIYRTSSSLAERYASKTNGKALLLGLRSFSTSIRRSNDGPQPPSSERGKPSISPFQSLNSAIESGPRPVSSNQGSEYVMSDRPIRCLQYYSRPPPLYGEKHDFLRFSQLSNSSGVLSTSVAPDSCKDEVKRVLKDPSLTDYRKLWRLFLRWDWTFLATLVIAWYVTEVLDFWYHDGRPVQLMFFYHLFPILGPVKPRLPKVSEESSDQSKSSEMSEPDDDAKYRKDEDVDTNELKEVGIVRVGTK